MDEDNEMVGFRVDGGDRDRGGVDRVPLMSNFTKLCLFVRLVKFIFVHAFLFPFENLCILFLIKIYYFVYTETRKFSPSKFFRCPVFPHNVMIFNIK